MARTYKIKHKDLKGELDITMSGQLTISNITKIVAEMKVLLKNASKVTINVKEVENMDLTFVQLLFAIKNSGRMENYKTNINMDLSEELTLLISNAGFQKAFNLN